MTLDYYDAVGIQHEGRIVNGIVQGVSDREMESLLLATIDTPSTSAESLALRDALGGASDPRWIAYLAVRQEPTTAARREQYQIQLLAILVKLFYTATYQDVAGGKIAVFDTALLLEAKQRVDAILADLPDPE